MKTLRYIYYRFLSKITTGELKKYYKNKKNKYKTYSFQEKTLISLRKIEDYLTFQKFYIIFKQLYGIEMPGEACGLGNNFEFIQKRLKDLKGWKPGEKNIWVPLNQTFQYKYLKTHSENVYKEYIKKCNFTDENLRLSIPRFKKLEKNIIKKGYNPKTSTIIIDENNCIRDGLHRASILLSLYGEDYLIPCIRITRKND